MKQKKIPLLITILLWANINLLAQIGQDQNYFQDGRNLYAKGLFLPAKTALKQALVQAKKENFFNDDQLSEIEYYIVLSEFHLDPNHIEQSIERYAKKYKNSPFANKLTNEIGSLYFKSGNYRLAADYLSTKLNRTETQTFQLAYSYFTLRDYSSAQKYLELLTKSLDNDISKPTLYYLGYIHYLNKNYENAISVLSEIDKKPLIIGQKTISLEENIQINKTYSSLWLQSLFNLDNKKPYKSIFDLVERKNIAQDNNQNVFTKDMQRFIAELYFDADKFEESVKIYYNLSIDPKSDSLIKYREAFAKLKKAGTDKGILKSVINDLNGLSKVKSDSLRQQVYRLLADAYTNLYEYKLAETALDRSIEINFDSTVSRNAALRKIQIYTDAKSFKSAYQQVYKYLLKYKEGQINDTFNNLFIQLLTLENNVSNSIENIKNLDLNAVLPKSLFEKYASSLFNKEIRANKRDFQKIKTLFDAATYFKIDQGEQIDIHLDFFSGILSETQKLTNELDEIKKKITSIEDKFNDDIKSQRDLNKNSEYISLKERRINISKEKNILLEKGIQLTSKYFQANSKELKNFRAEKYNNLANNLIYSYFNSNNVDYQSQVNLVNEIFESDISSDSTRKNSILLFEDIISSNSNYWNNYFKITNLSKLPYDEKDFYAFVGIVIKKQTLDLQNKKQLDEFYTMVDDYNRIYVKYKAEVNELEKVVIEDDDSPTKYPNRINIITAALEKSKVNSKEYFINLFKRIEVNKDFGKKQNLKFGDSLKIPGKKEYKINKFNLKYKEIKQDLLYVIDNSSDSKVISNTINELFDLSHENEDELAFLERFPKSYPSKATFWNDCIKIRNTNILPNAITAFNLFATTFPEKNVKYNVTFELARIYFEQKDSLNAESKFKELLSDWKYYESDSSTIKYATYILPKISLKHGKHVELEKLYATIPSLYLPKEFSNTGHLNYLISQSISLKSVEAEKYYLELLSNNTNYEVQSLASKKYYLDKHEKLLRMYKNEEPNSTTEKKIKVTLKKLIHAKEDQQIQNQLKNNYLQLADLAIKDDSLDDFWNAISVIKAQRNSTNDSIRYTRKLVEYRDVRCQKNDSINVTLINQELIVIGRKIPGIIKTKTEKDAGANAILDHAKNLWYSNKFTELNHFLNDYLYGEASNTLLQSQMEIIYPEAFLFLGLSFEKLNNCFDSKNLFAQALNLPLVAKDTNIHSIIMERFNQLKCAQ